MADLRTQQIKDRYQSLLTTSEVTSDPTTGTLQNGKGTAFTALTVAGVAIGTGGITYETGTWTPSLTFGGGATGLTTSLTVGRYTRIGNKVSLSGVIVLTAKGSSTGDVIVGNLPFTAGSGTESICVGNLSVGNVTFANILLFFNSASSTIINIRQTNYDGISTNLTNANFIDTSSLTFTLTYFT